MQVNLAPFTRELKECRRRWNRRSHEYILESARILCAARETAKSDRRWTIWLREEAHMHPSTASRHLSAARFLRSNRALKQHFGSLSLAKVYALSRMKPVLSHRLARDERVRSMTDVQFARYIRHYLPTPRKPATAHNLFLAIMAGIEKAGRGVARWKNLHPAATAAYRARIRSRLRELLAAVMHVRATPRRAL